MSSPTPRPKSLSLLEVSVFGLLGAVMFLSKPLTEAFPNIHLLAMFTVTYTNVFRKKAIFPILIFILLVGVFYGFGIWWIPYFYLWPILWAVALLLPKDPPVKIAFVIYPLLCALHGICYGTLYAPFQALAFHLNFQQMLAWIAAGFPWDVTHAIGNFFFGFLVWPLTKFLRKTMPKQLEIYRGPVQ